MSSPSSQSLRRNAALVGDDLLGAVTVRAEDLRRVADQIFARDLAEGVNLTQANDQGAEALGAVGAGFVTRDESEPCLRSLLWRGLARKLGRAS